MGFGLCSSIGNIMVSKYRSLSNVEDDSDGEEHVNGSRSKEQEVVHEGGCHCGAVRFRVTAPANVEVIHCSCSICVKRQNHHFIVPASKFELLKGEDQLTVYTFNKHQAKHTFCKVCGVQSFYTPRSNPDGKGIAVHCIDSDTIKRVTVTHFDGKNWEQSMAKDTSIRKMSIDN